MIDFDPVRGREHGGRRPGVVVSVDIFNQGPANLFVVVPVTSRFRDLRWRVRVDPPEGGLDRTSYVVCESPRALATERLLEHLGHVSQRTMGEIERRLRILLDL